MEENTDSVGKEEQTINQMQTKTAEPVAESVQETTQASSVEYAGFWIRFAAALIDGIVLIIPSIIIQFIFGKNFGNLLQLILIWAYAIYMLNTRQATLGKMAVGLKVTAVNGDKSSIGKLALREILGKILNVFTLYIGFFMIAFTKKKQGLHDIIADTVVIYDPERKPKKWLVVLSIFVVLILPMMLAIILVSLKSARNKASDEASQQYSKAIIPSALIYADEHGNSFIGYMIPSTVKFPPCSKNPIINISPDGQNIAVIAQSCADSDVYYCVDGNISDTDYSSKIVNKDSAFALSGKSSCK